MTSPLPSRLGTGFVLAALFFAAGCAALRSTQQEKPAVAPDVVAVIENNSVNVSEFERRYARTAGSWEAAAQDSMPAYKKFLERYVNFRLKVRAAKDAGYENDPEVQEEMANYQKSFARPRLMEEKVLRPLAREIYERRQEQVDVSHILIRMPPNAPPADTLKAYRKMQSLVDSLQQGADFGDLALRHSEDPSASRKPNARGYRGRLGYMPAGRVVKPFEDAAYNTPAGERSGIFRSKFGYHVLKVHDRRPTPSKIRVAHIMVRPNNQTSASPGGTDPEEKIHQLQDSLAAGVPFAALARRHSADRRSARRGGDLGAFIGPNARLPKPFKEAAFDLDEEGDVSDVVQTRAGYHLIKLLKRKKKVPFEKAYPKIKKRLKKLPRTEQATEALAQKVRRKQGVQVDSALVRRAMSSTAPADSVHARLVSGRFEKGLDATDVVARLGDNAYTLGDLSRFAQQHKNASKGETNAPFSLLNNFLDARAIDVATANLEDRDEEFGALMREFRNGVLLFQLMEDSVWTKAQQDTSALRAYYNKHRSRYRFPQRIRALGFVSRSDSALEVTAERLDTGRPLTAVVRDLQADSTGPVVRVDTMMVTDSTEAAPYAEVRDLRESEHLNVQSYGDQRSILVVHDGELAPRPMRFKEAIPSLSSDYQDVLEDHLLHRLRRKYAVYTYPKHLSSAFKGAKPDDFGATTTSMSAAAAR